MIDDWKRAWRAAQTTPAPAASGGLTDIPSGRQIGPGLALLLIVGLYAAMFADGVVSSFLVAFRLVGDGSPQVEDYSNPRWWPDFGIWASQIALVIAVLVIVRTYVLRVPWSLAGVADRSARAWPAAATVAAALLGLLVAEQVKSLVEGAITETSLPTDTAGNVWALWGILRSVNAGVVEEITIVALPVLLLRHIGWRPGWIIGLSVLLRYPFHIYHGAWSALPWAIVWGGAYCAAFLYWRRLLPLILVHAFWDIRIISTEAWGPAGGLWTVAVAIVLVVWLLARMLRDRWTRLDSRADRPSWAVSWFLLRTEPVALLMVSLVLLLAAGAAGLAVLQDDPTLWPAAVVLLVSAWAVGSVLARSLAVQVGRDHRGRLQAAVAWADNRRPGVVDLARFHHVDICDAARIVAEHEPTAHTITIPAVGKTDIAKLTAAGQPITRPPGRIGKYAVIPREVALTLHAGADR